MMTQKNLKQKAIVVEVINKRIFRVKLEDGTEVLGILSTKIEARHPSLLVGDDIVVLRNPYENNRVKIHEDTWGKR